VLGTFRRVAVALLLIAVSSAGAAIAAEQAPPRDEMAGIAAAVERIERLLEQLLEGSREQAIASLYATTMGRITTLEERLQQLETELRTAEDVVDESRSRLDELRSGVPPVGVDDENREESIAYREEKVREYDGKAVAVAAKIRDLTAELAALRAQRQELEEAIADQF